MVPDNGQLKHTIVLLSSTYIQYSIKPILRRRDEQGQGHEKKQQNTEFNVYWLYPTSGGYCTVLTGLTRYSGTFIVSMIMYYLLCKKSSPPSNRAGSGRYLLDGSGICPTGHQVLSPLPAKQAITHLPLGLPPQLTREAKYQSKMNGERSRSSLPW
ncbi:hypothetical protein GGR51DRAFT_449776 [Nemania sp. FL0031]|nr:hypothetical protein GGR51DRAFT_449776 [Nemania sp. FL0031]